MLQTEWNVLWWMDKTTVVHPNTGILLQNGIIGEKIIGSCNNVDECQMPLAKWKKPESKDCILCGSNYMTCWKMRKLQEQISGLLGAEWVGWGPQLRVKEQFEGSLGELRTGLILIRGGPDFMPLLHSLQCAPETVNLHILRRWVKADVFLN